YDDLLTPTKQFHSSDFLFFEQTNLPNTTLNNSFISLSTSEDILSSDDLIILSSSQSTKKKNK
ncbi:13352_t:CDS:1, partial [Gigaspora rosea]